MPYTMYMHTNKVYKMKYCKGCKQTKERKFFSVRKSSTDGLRTYCKECDALEFSKKPKYKPTEKKYLCSDCNVIKPVGEFIKNPRLKRGVRNQCKLCVLKRRNSKDVELFLTSRTEKLCTEFNLERPVYHLKKCSGCSRPKSLDEYHKHSGNLDGVSSTCKECATASGGGNVFTSHKAKAARRFRAAIQRNKLNRPDICSCCMKTEREAGTMEGHHTNYSKPLEVDWLCNVCHRDWHSKWKFVILISSPNVPISKFKDLVNYQDAFVDNFHTDTNGDKHYAVIVKR